ncbi:CGNR zinc finger domain-containing protein [Frigoribacterium sp. 2-23]|uniref:CGNR zinc finger domain-containing protein n=1 Tax=Frigoribacterium sp. 2-23 TaxID=3415006 RepID=UPI003C6EE2BB
MTASSARLPYPEVGGHPAFDLVDTVHWRLDERRAIDTMTSFEDVVMWCRQFDLLERDAGGLDQLAEDDPASAANELEVVVALREAIYQAVFESSTAAVEVIAREHVAALGRSTLHRDTDAPTWSWRVPSDLTGPRAAIAFVAHDLLTSDLTSARQCGDDACGWVYLDTSPRHNRVWCTAAGCGNRNRVARHQAKKRA